MTNHMNRDSHEMSHKAEALYWTLCTYSVHHFKPFCAFHFTHPSAPPFTSHPISHSLFPFWRCCDAFEDVDWWETCVKQREERVWLHEDMAEERSSWSYDLSFQFSSFNSSSTNTIESRPHTCILTAWWLHSYTRSLHQIAARRFSISISISSTTHSISYSFRMNASHKHTQETLPPTVHIAHQSSMHRHLPSIHIPSQSGVNACTIESIQMSYCIDLLAMRIDTMNRIRLSITHCALWVLHHIMHNKPEMSLIHMNCSFTPSWQLNSDSIQLPHIGCVTRAETEGTCNHMDRSENGKQHHHRCD